MPSAAPYLQGTELSARLETQISAKPCLKLGTSQNTEVRPKIHALPAQSVQFLQSYRKWRPSSSRWRLRCSLHREPWATSWQVSADVTHCRCREDGGKCTCVDDAVMAHCGGRDDEMIVGDLSHIHVYEQGGSAYVSATTCTSPPPSFSPVMRFLRDCVDS